MALCGKITLQLTEKGYFSPSQEVSGGMEMTLVRIHEEIMSAAVFS